MCSTDKFVTFLERGIMIISLPVIVVIVLQNESSNPESWMRFTPTWVYKYWVSTQYTICGFSVSLRGFVKSELTGNKHGSPAICCDFHLAGTITGCWSWGRGSPNWTYCKGYCGGMKTKLLFYGQNWHKSFISWLVIETGFTSSVKR